METHAILFFRLFFVASFFLLSAYSKETHADRPAGAAEANMKITMTDGERKTAILNGVVDLECGELKPAPFDNFKPVTDLPGLGKAVEDPYGIVWGEIVKDMATGRAKEHSGPTALSYCKTMGARLPTPNEYSRMKSAEPKDPSSLPSYLKSFYEEHDKHEIYAYELHPSYAHVELYSSCRRSCGDAAFNGARSLWGSEFRCVFERPKAKK